MHSSDGQCFSSSGYYDSFQSHSLYKREYTNQLSRENIGPIITAHSISIVFGRYSRIRVDSERCMILWNSQPMYLSVCNRTQYIIPLLLLSLCDH